MKKSIGVIPFLFLFLVFTGKAFGSSISYVESPSSSTFSPTDEISFRINLSINTANDTNYYLRGVFYKKGSSNYCGYTWNGNGFFNGPYSTNEGWKQFLKATIVNNEWQGEIKTKIDSEDSGCKESGEYEFKIQRFTESGSGNFDTQDGKVFTFIIPTPTPTHTPTSAPTPTPKPAKTSTPTKTPTPIKSQETDSTRLPSPNQSKNITATSTANIKKDYVLGASQFITKVPIPTKKKKEEVKRSTAGKIIVTSGAILLASSCGILMYKKYKKEKGKKEQV